MTPGGAIGGPARGQPRPLTLAIALLLAVLVTACASDDRGSEAGAQEPGASSVSPRVTDGDSASTSATTATSVAPTTASSSTSSATSTSTSTTVAPTLPERILVAGDSMVLGVRPVIEAAYRNDDVEVQDTLAFLGFLAEGAGEPVWPTALAEPPDAVVLMLGVWENFAVRSGEVLDPAAPDFEQRYADDFVRPVAEQLSEAEVEVFWVGITRVLEGATNEGGRITNTEYDQLNRVWADVAADYPTIHFIDGTALLAGPDGRPRAIAPDSEVRYQRVLNLDGLHLCPAAGYLLGNAVLEEMRAALGISADPNWVDSDWAENPEGYRPGECPEP